MHALCFSSSVSSFVCVFFVASSCVCLFVSIAIAPNSIVFLEINNNFLLFPHPPVHLLTCLLLFFAIDFRLRLFSWWRAFDCSRFLLAAGCRQAVWFFRFSVLAVCGRFFWLHFPGALAGPCMNVVLFLAAILMRYFQALRNLAENSFFLSF